MQSIICFVFALLFSLAYAQQPINWSTLNATSLSQIFKTQFANITSDQLASIPVDAIPGFSAGQISFIPPAASPGWTSAQIALLPVPACEGFTFANFQTIPPPAFSGFTNSCVYNWNYQITRYISPNQFANLTLQGWAGLTIDMVLYLPANCCALISAPQLAIIRTLNCYGLDYNCLHFMPSASFAGLRSNCIARSQASAWEQVTPDQISYIAPAQFYYFEDDYIDAFSDETFASLSALQIANMSNSGIAGISAERLVNLTNSYGTNLFSVSRFTEYPLRDMRQFVSLVPSTINYQPFAGNLSELSWLQLALLPPLSENTTFFDSSFFANIDDATIGGLRWDQFEQISLEALQNFTVDQFAYIGPDLISNFSAPQLNALSPAVFASLPLSFLSLLPLSTWQSVSPSSLSLLSPSLFSEMSCSFLGQFTTDQIAALDWNQTDAFLEQQYICQNTPSPTPTPLPSTTSSLTSTTSSTTNGTSSTSSSSSSSSSTGQNIKYKLSAPKAVGFTFMGVFVGAAVAAGAVMVYMRKRRHYQPLV